MITRLRHRYAWFDHLVRALDRYIEHNAYQYAAAITYFSVLSVVPILMVGLSVTGFILADSDEITRDLRITMIQALPSGLDSFAANVYDNVIAQRASLGVFGLVIGLYAGWGWMNALRDALTAMWDLERPQLPFFRTILWDLLALISLAIALLVSFSLTAAGSWLNSAVLRWTGMDDQPWAGTVLSLLSVPLAIFADWLVFLWVLIRLPRAKVHMRSAIRGALAAAIGFEILKIAANVYLSLLGRSPTTAAFGSIIGLLVFIYLVARLLLLVATWIATAGNPDPTPAVVQPEQRPEYLGNNPAGPPLGLAAAGWLVAAGAVAALWIQRTFRRKTRR
ncbi:YihY/virulence factor BrkB family protein [Kibdelosporangium philippinense]|uniref:YihY/virulence factor BrkB family protein n=1 Tax=Kibdelosporangium philippinense TaxID=211113 RepID=A0ABS8ZUW3_9PSEU|nr:YhjD/YihY/BrkB family envelope integrity protein [Kibdelosporangium philippinense]MCE7011392.1 YihY/virulence factor BrkB family protein [Kibdelosporangium philippinense]